MLMLDVLDCGDPERTGRRKALYENYGFRALEAEPLRMFLPMGTVRMVVDGELEWPETVLPRIFKSELR
ncbi:hypothetical protein CHN51_01350 [Sphingorhabdus sp. YGSMI21]|nr:hypothetical protein CHN51_01350 [Sphingorhabdus sp. YGSMI21]